MGVFGLASYVERLSNFGVDVLLCNTKVVIDGSSLYYGLYFNSQLDCRSGGQYQQFHDNLRSFFEHFKLNRVQPYVILDGSSSVEKFDTDKRRVTESISRTWSLANGSDPELQVRALLIRRTFIQTLDEIGVKFAICDGEADQEIASLAAKWECPVISNDSDFFIFDLKGGYIPLEHLDWRSGQLKAKLFRVEKLSAHLEIQKELLPLVASLLGNNFVNNDVRKPLYNVLGIRDWNIEKRIAAIVSHFQEKNVGSLQHGIESVKRLLNGQSRKWTKLSPALQSSINSYKVYDSKIPAYFEDGEVNSRLKSWNAVPFDSWVTKKFRQGSFPILCVEAFTVGRLLFRSQVEDVSAPSADQCSIELRKFAYGVLGKGEVRVITEWKRDGEELREDRVQPSHYLHGFGELPSLRNIPNLRDAERRDLCLSLLESHTDPILSLPAESQLFAASVRYWIKHAQPEIKESHLSALLVCSLLLTEGDHHDNKIPSQFDLAAQQSFAQWQCVMQEAVNVNQILQEPLHTPRIRNLYDGLLVHSLVWDSSVVSEITLEKAQSLYNAVTDGISGRLLP